ncbi:MAG: hypothetical protein SVN78_04050 [Deferribacterota bacterium]|nr:hypothetical protein [Deferribacterota bacterium]
MVERVNIDLNDNELWPLFFDYDFDSLKPRGYSGRVELFSFSKIYSLLESTEYFNSIVYVKIKNLIFKYGIFLVDYSKLLLNESDYFVDRLLAMGIGSFIFMAESRYFDVEEMFRFDNRLLVKFFKFE